MPLGPRRGAVLFSVINPIDGATQLRGDWRKNVCHERVQFSPTRQEGARRKSPRAIRLKIRLVAQTAALNRPSNIAHRRTLCKDDLRASPKGPI